MFFRFIKFLLYLPIKIFYPTKVVGKDNLPKDGGLIFACNHSSNMDVIIIAVNIKRRFKFMAKDSLFKNKLFGKALKSLGAYPIVRGKADLKAIKATLTYLKNGEAVCMFPQGTRINSEEMGELKNGASMFSLKTGVPIVPAYLIHKPRFCHKNTLMIGQGIDPTCVDADTDTSKDNITKLSDILTQKMKNLEEEYNKQITQKLINKKMKIKAIK